MDQAIAIVNDNLARIDGGLKAVGSARGHGRDSNGHRRHYDLRTVLLVVPPDHVRFDLRNTFGQSEILLGANDEKLWLYVRRDDDTYRVGHRDGLDLRTETGLPIRPEVLTDALGLNALPSQASGLYGPVQRIADRYQQLLFLTDAQDGHLALEKEYWLERYPPQLVRKIIYRDSLGRVYMESQLDRYKPVAPLGPMLPHVIHVRWPQEDAVLNLHIRRWQMRPDLRPTHMAFVAPHDRGKTFKHMIDIVTHEPLR